ncbi:organic cation transporter protein-like [Dermacentor albipictus]|uniref:organic cation transporter protein-like n=1 Tax=Dermacentor albipictus TaxID=60249 RepID=UPI0038FC5C53
MTALEEQLYALINHGPYQHCVLWCAVLGITAVFMEMMAYRIIARPVNHWCRPPDELAHLTADAWKNLSVPVEPDRSYSQCTVYVMTSMESPENLHKQRCRSWDYGIKDWGDSIVSRFDVVCDRKFLFTVASLLPTLSYAVLMPVAGLAADRLGRKPVSTISGCILLVAAVGCSVAVNYTIFLVNRLVLITCGAFSYLTTFVLLYEVTGSAQRWVATLLHMAVAATAVPPFLNLLSAQEPCWSLAHVVFIVPKAAFATWCSQLDESPVWLLATRRVNKAKRVILAAARLNHVDEENAKERLQALWAELRKTQHSDDTSMLPSSPSDAISEAIKMRRHATAAFFSRFACGGAFFGLMITDTLSRLYWQGAHVVFSVVCYIVITRAMNSYGPRHTLQGLLAATCASAVARATSAYVGFDTAAACVRASMKILASGSVGVVICYLGTFSRRKTGAPAWVCRL